MKSYIYIIVITILTISCNKTKTEKRYFSDGKIKCQYEIKNGIREGVYISYYHSGITHVKCGFNQNKINGSYVEFYEDQTIKTKGTFLDGKPYGLFLLL